ncbi:hypothetical protein ABFX02_04G218200 [Erythranthe guttata]
MDCCLSYAKSSFTTLPAAAAFRRPIAFCARRRPSSVVASSRSASKCEFSGLSAPLVPTTPAGRFLTGVLLDNPGNFQITATEELRRLAAERDVVAARLQLSLGSDEACLHRRIAELKQNECQNEVEDIMYMMILHKFSEMRVHLVPKLSKCVYKGRFEIWPSKEWELESIHSFEVLQMVREHLSAVIGCKGNANVTDTWVTTKIQRLRLCRLYAASILYGYFLKSASLRHFLERVLNTSTSNFSIGGQGQSQLPVSEIFSVESNVIGCVGQISQENLGFYVMGFDQEMIQMCAKPKSIEAMNLIERHSCALFGDEVTTDDVITTSFASLKRFLLEAVDFSSFLWESENSVSDVYMLDEN